MSRPSCSVASSTRPRRSRGVPAAALVLGAVAALPPGSAAAAPEPCWAEVQTDVDGGGPDVVVGLPSYDVAGKRDAGAIVVFSDVGVRGQSNPRAPRASRVLTADDFPGLSSQAGARFGASVVVWRDAGPSDDEDSCSDVLVGSPGQTVAGQVGAGQVARLSGAPGGLAGARQTFDEASLPGTGGAQAGAAFGASIAADAHVTIAVGAPRRDAGGVVDAGRVVRLEYTTSTTPAVSTIEQGVSGADSPEPHDRFGEVLELMPSAEGSILAVGIPREDVGGQVDAGAVALMPRSGPLSMVHQDSPGAGGAAEAGDAYGASIDSYVAVTTHTIGVVVVGVPGEDLAGKQDAGLVSFASFDLFLSEQQPISPLRGWSRTMTQDAAAVPGIAETGDRYGSAVLAGKFGHDAERLDLVAGTPSEDLGATADAGMVTATRSDAGTAAPTGSQPAAWTQDSTGVPGAAERGDRLGAAMSSVSLTRLQQEDDVVWPVMLVTVPHEDAGTLADTGMAYLGFAPGAGSVPLVPPVQQQGAGIGMVPMHASG